MLKRLGTILIRNSFSTISVRQPNRVKVAEMFLRDGLQSHSKHFSMKERFQFFKEMDQCRFPTMEIGSMTSSKLIPQMRDSLKLWKRISEYDTSLPYTGTNYTMLFPSQKSLERTIPETPITSFGLIMSLSEEFSRRNQNKCVLEAYEEVMRSIEYIHLCTPEAHIRVYISCSFGSPWEEWRPIQKYILNTIVRNLTVRAMDLGYSYHDFDIVLADTTGECSKERVEEVLFGSMLSPYVGLHLHTRGDFQDVINTALERGIRKFDSSLLGIGGCPYSHTKDNGALGNISTLPLVEHLETSGYNTGIDIDRVKWFSMRNSSIVFPLRTTE